jgi:hypothetical protein
MNWFDSEMLNLIFGAIGAALGYWLRGGAPRLTPTPSTPTPATSPSPVAPELVEALRLLLERHCQKQTQALLNNLLAEHDKEKRA